MMKCPYCNTKLIITYNGLACSNMRCEKSRGMIGTELMWEKVASLAKIRNAGKKYLLKPETIQKRKEYMAQKYATDSEFKEKVLKNGRKWREINKDKVAERNKKYRETHREYYKEYMKKYNQKKKDRKCK